MGSTVVQAVTAAADLSLAAQVDIGWSATDLTSNNVRVAVDFTTPQATEANVHQLIDLGVHAVVGTSGWDKASLGRLSEHLAQQPNVGVLVAPNFALGAVLSELLAVQAVKFFESVEMIEMHHPDKLDAPSGTACHTAEALAAARRNSKMPSIPDATVTALPGARGAAVEDVRVHAVRLRGLVAHQEILLGNPGELLTIRHDSLDRVSFMPGVLLAIRQVAAHPGLTVGLDQFLELT
jgi:4-hydroxy-tetrahydrodipicolinate reductase